jgi:phosphate:Na+ symporter
MLSCAYRRIRRSTCARQNIGACTRHSAPSHEHEFQTRGRIISFLSAGTLIYLILLTIFPHIVTWIQSLSPDNVSRQIANFHTLFNVSVTILLFPLAGQMVKLVSLIIKDKPKPGSAEKKLVYLDERIIQTPAIALSQTMKELNRMGAITRDNFGLALDAFFRQDELTVNKVAEIEKTVDFLSDNITNYMINFRGAELPEHDLKQLGKLHHVIIDLERISDRAENIAEYTMTLIDTKEKMTPDALGELQIIADKTMDVFQLSLEIFKTRDLTGMDALEAMKREVDKMQRVYTENHIHRLQEELCRPHTGGVFTNMLASLERIASHSINIAYSVDLES